MENKLQKTIIIIFAIGAIILLYFLFTTSDENVNEISPEDALNTVNTNELTNTNKQTTMTNSDSEYSFPGILSDEKIKNKQVTLNTNKGVIKFELYADDAPNTVSNFIYLTESGYYDGLTFHRVEPGFVIQGGDPDGTGTGGPGYKFADETVTRDYDQGIVAMANSGPDTNGSQFFIMLEDNPTLPKQYTIFGKVTEGMDIVKQIEVGDIMETVVVE